MKTIIFITKILRQYPKLIVNNVCLLVLSTVISIGSLFSIAPIIDFLVHDKKEMMSPLSLKLIQFVERYYDPAPQIFFIILFITFMIASASLTVILRYYMLRMQYEVMRDIIVGAFRNCFNATWYFFSTNKIGTLINTFTRETDIVGSAFRAMSHIVANAIQAVLLLAVPLSISWKFTCICLLLTVLFSMGYMQFGKVTYRLGKQNLETANIFSAILQEAFGSAKLILGFGNKDKIIEKIDDAFYSHSRVSVKSQTISGAILLMITPGVAITVVLAFYYSKSISFHLSSMSILIVSVTRIMMLIGQISSLKTTLDNFLPSYVQLQTTNRNALMLKQVSGNTVFKKLERDLRLEDVCFSYPDQRDVLKGITIHVSKGKMTALMGPSGVGKSTLIDLIIGFNQPEKGRICVDGKDLKKIDIISYRKRIGYVQQDSVLFNMSIRDNLLWAEENASEEDILNACRIANADEFIDNLNEGYDTIVGDRGVRLSGGQVQRIALARAILRKPELLILDEATSSLDTYSEKLIQDALEKISKETTIIAVTHRLSTIANADYIYILDDGRIVEAGTYGQLLNNNGPFAKMVALQNIRINPEGAETI